MLLSRKSEKALRILAKDLQRIEYKDESVDYVYAILTGNSKD